MDTLGLARYLAKYVASPPIAVRRIIRYDGRRVKYWYQDHKSKRKKFEEVDVFTFIGRMVQHILPKGFQRVRYYGLQATRTFNKWAEAIRKGLQRIGRVISPFKVVLLFRSLRKNFSSRDMRCIFAAFTLWLRLFRASGMFAKG